MIEIVGSSDGGAALRAHLSQPVTTLCRLWTLTRRDGAVYRYTDLDRSLVVAGHRYEAAVGYRTSALQARAGLAPSNAEVEAVFDSLAITEEDLQAGLWDGADVQLEMVNYADPGMGRLPMPKGNLGRVRYDRQAYSAELLGLMHRLAANIGRVVNPGCDAIFGDARCGLSIAALTHSFAVTASPNRLQFTDSALAQAAGYFRFGLVQWTGGANAGRKHEIKEHAAGGAITLFLPAESNIAVGDTGTIIAGCDKSFATCRDTFDNALNFRGFPHVPGNDRVLAPKRAA